MRPKHRSIVLFGILSGGCSLEAGEAATETHVEAQTESALCRNALSSSEEKTVLKLIDDICGDTWCEGDHNFAFDRLTCRSGASGAPNGGTCTLRLRLIPHDDGSRAHPRTCTTDGFFGFDSLVQTSESGHSSLDWDYYLALTDCVARLEAELTR